METSSCEGISLSEEVANSSEVSACSDLSAVFGGVKSIWKKSSSGCCSFCFGSCCFTNSGVEPNTLLKKSVFCRFVTIVSFFTRKKINKIKATNNQQANAKPVFFFLSDMALL